MPESFEDERTGSFTRWQGITIGQHTIAINAILAFAGAALAFEVDVLIRKEFQPVGWARSAFVGSLVTLLVSMGVGVWCVINRLLDFRSTTTVARMRETGAPQGEIEPLRSLSIRLGKRTWKLFWWQVAMFLVGVCLMVVSVSTAMWGTRI